MASLAVIFSRLSINLTTEPAAKNVAALCYGSVRFLHQHIEIPEPGVKGKSYRRIVHFPKEYTVKPLDVTNLAGRDPVTGRLVVGTLGGGIKHKYHWIDWKRVGPKEGPPLVEKVIKILVDGCRTAHIALVGVGDKMKYILATENMKAGDMIKTSCHIPRNPVRANEGDAFPLGALPLGTKVHSIEKYPGTGGALVHAAGSYATIIRKAPNNHVVIQLPSKREYSLPETCMCTVGRLSNAIQSSIPIGSANRLRELGYRPRSGLWHRKTGKHGRKLRRLPPCKTVTPYEVTKDNLYRLTLNSIPNVIKTYEHRKKLGLLKQ